MKPKKKLFFLAISWFLPKYDKNIILLEYLCIVKKCGVTPTEQLERRSKT